MQRFAFLVAVACLWGCLVTGAGRADVIYDVYSGGKSGTLLAEYDVSDYMTDGFRDNSFTPTFLPPLVATPGVLGAGTLGINLAQIAYLDNILGVISAVLESAQLPSSPGTYALNTQYSTAVDDHGMQLGTPDTLVVTDTTVPEPASLTLIGVGAVGLLGYGMRPRKRAAT